MDTKSHNEDSPKIIKSPYLTRGGGGGYLDFENQAVVQGMVRSRGLEIEPGLTVGEEIARNADDFFNLKSGDIVADLGCGPGLISAYFLPKIAPSGHLYCLDASNAMLSQATKVLSSEHTTIINGDIHVSDKLIPEQVNAVLLSGNVHLLTNRKLAFTAIRRLLKPCGKLVVVCHAYFHPAHSTNYFSRLVDEKKHERPELRLAGLRLPMLSEQELSGIVATLQGSGLNVFAREDDSCAPDINWVFGFPPERTVVERLQALCPNMAPSERQFIARGIVSDVTCGRQSQIYLECTPKEVPFKIGILR